MAQIRIRHLARLTGIDSRELVRKLRAIGLAVETDEDFIDTSNLPVVRLGLPTWLLIVAVVAAIVGVILLFHGLAPEP